MHKILAEETCVDGLDIVHVSLLPFSVCISSLTVSLCAFPPSVTPPSYSMHFLIIILSDVQNDHLDVVNCYG